MTGKLDFKGKTAIVTGATRGIGKTIAENLHSLGAELILTGTNKTEVDKLNGSVKSGENIKYFQLDLSDDISIRQFINDVKEYKKIDILINNAGINRINHIYEIPETDWNELVKVNLNGPFILSKEIGKLMKDSGYGRIVNIASIFGVVTREKRAAYTATKAGLIGLTKTTAVDLAPYNVLVNAVSPGFVLTDLTRNILSDDDIKELEARIPMGRFGTARDISNVVIFLASDLNTYITGQNIIVDGGYVNL